MSLTPQRPDRYFFLPGPENPKYLLNAEGRWQFLQGLFFYPDFSLKARVKRKALSLLYPALPYLLSRGKHSPHKLSEMEYIQQVRDFLSSYGYCVNFYIPRPGKIVAQILGENGKVSAYAKVGFSHRVNYFTKNEAKTLGFLKQVNISSFETPQVLDFLERDNLVALILSTRPVLHYEKNLSLTSILPVLREIYSLNLREFPLRENPHFVDIRKRAVGKPLFKKTIEKVLEEMGGERLPAGFIHYDFKPWNIMINEGSGKPFIIDWEFSRFDGLPLWDHFTFTFLSGTLTRDWKSSPQTILRKFSLYQPALQGELRHMGLKEEFLNPLFSLYLVDIITFLREYGHRDKRTGGLIEKTEKILRLHEQTHQ